MKIRSTLLVFTFILSMSFKTPEKINNTDMRAIPTVLSIKNSKAETFSLKKSINGQYFLEKSKKSKSIMFKLSSSKAQKIDETFVERFINLKYMMTPFSGKKCDVEYELNMRGEKSQVCKAEALKVKESKKLVGLLKKYFI